MRPLRLQKSGSRNLSASDANFQLLEMAEQVARRRSA